MIRLRSLLNLADEVDALPIFRLLSDLRRGRWRRASRTASNSKRRRDEGPDRGAICAMIGDHARPGSSPHFRSSRELVS